MHGRPLRNDRRAAAAGWSVSNASGPWSNLSPRLRSSPDRLPVRHRKERERYHLPAFPFSLRRFFSRAFRGVASRTALRRKGARRESGNRFAAPAQSRGVSRSASSPAAFSVPFLAGQKGDSPTDPTCRTAFCRQKFVAVVYRTTCNRGLPVQLPPAEC
jgi:hypothetical protein